MKKQEFIDKLDSLGISQKEFAAKTSTAYKTVNNWNDTSRPVPGWVDSWLDNCEKALQMDRVAEAIVPYMSGKQ